MRGAGSGAEDYGRGCPIVSETKTVNRYLSTSDLAKAVGVHPNTVRLYEQ